MTFKILLFLNLLITGLVSATTIEPTNQIHTSADFFKFGFHNCNNGRLILVDGNVKKLQSDVKKLDTKLGDLQKNFESLLSAQNLIYNRLIDYDSKLNKIIKNTKPKSDDLKEPLNQNTNYQYNDDLQNNQSNSHPNRRRLIVNRVLVGRSAANDDYNHDFINEFIQNVQNWQNRTDLKLTKIMNVITEIYREDKQLSLDLSRLNDKQPNEDKSDLMDRMRKEFKEQFSINKAELKSYISNVNENCLKTKTQNENLTFLLLGIKDDLSNPVRLIASTTKFNNLENSVLPLDEENKNPLLDLNSGSGGKGEAICKNTNNLINTTIEQFRSDLNNAKQLIINRIDKENARINERIYTLNNNYQHLNNLRNCNSSLPNLSNVQQDGSSNEIDSQSINDFSTTTTTSTSKFIPPFYQESRKRDDDRSKTVTRIKLINPIKSGQIKKKNCHVPNIMSPSNCEELYLDRVNCDGIYVIVLKEEASRVYCEIDDDSGSTILMRRGQFNDYPLTKFNQNWFSYKKGFGNIDADFWLGLDKIYELTRNRNQMLEINLESFDGQQLTLKYNQFYIDDESNNFKLTIGEPLNENQNLNYANQFLQHNGASFLTSDRNDFYKCAKKFEAGWWFFNNYQCHNVLLNGAYYQNSTPMYKDGIQWPSWPKKQYLKAVQMKIRDKKLY